MTMRTLPALRGSNFSSFPPAKVEPELWECKDRPKGAYFAGIFLFPEHGKRVFPRNSLHPRRSDSGFSAVEKKKNWGAMQMAFLSLTE